MRAIAGFFALVLASGAALAQDAPAPAAKPAATAKPTATKPVAKPKAAAATSGKAADELPASSQGVRDSYNAIPAAERMALQSDLVWTGDYNGLINGEYSERLVAAVKAFQKRNKMKETGVLNLQERTALSASATQSEPGGGRGRNRGCPGVPETLSCQVP